MSLLFNLVVCLRLLGPAVGDESSRVPSTEVRTLRDARPGNLCPNPLSRFLRLYLWPSQLILSRAAVYLFALPTLGVGNHTPGQILTLNHLLEHPILGPGHKFLVPSNHASFELISWPHPLALCLRSYPVAYLHTPHNPL